MSHISTVNYNTLLGYAWQVRKNIDYLRFALSSPMLEFERILDILDHENSCEYHDQENWFSYFKEDLKMWRGLKMTKSYCGLSIPVLLYNPFDEKTRLLQKMETKFWRIDFYGSCFRLIEIGLLPYNFVDIIIKNNCDYFPRITRVDFAMDFFSKDIVSMPTMEDTIPNLNSRSVVKQQGKWSNITSWSAWSRDSGRVIIRMYDKLLDLSWKWKFFYYQDYTQRKTVHRLEFEFWSSFTRGFDYSTLNLLLEKIDNVIWGKKIVWSIFYDYDPKNDFLDEEYKKRFLASFVKKAQKLFDAWINPYLEVFYWLQEYDRFVNHSTDKNKIYLNVFLDILKVKYDISGVVW